MTDFNEIKTQVQEQFNKIKDLDLFVVDVDTDLIWDTYLTSFEDLSVRQEHNCNCCKQFLRNYGAVVAIIDNQIRTIWDFEVMAPFNHIPGRLKKLIEESVINNVFLSTFNKLGTDFNHQSIDGHVVRHEHFYLELPTNKVHRGIKSIESANAELVSIKNVFKRSLEELAIGASETVIELIAQNSLYRGDEFKAAVTTFAKHQLAYNELSSDKKDLYCWSNYKEGGKIRNTAIGTLLIDLSNDMDLDAAVRKFEHVVAPTNYKRPTAIVTKQMIESAEKTLNELGLTQSLGRKYATVDDIPVNQLLFVNRDVSKVISTDTLFDELKADLKVNPKQLSKIEEISIDDFTSKVVPLAESIEVLLENKHSGNFMTLVSAIDNEAPVLFNWDNHISWAYQSGVADSVKERVKQAGGTVEGELRISLDWFNYDDLDLHVIEPSGNRISFNNKRSHISGGFLDVDMNAGSGTSREAVENIIFADKRRMQDGEYQVIVNNYNLRETADVGFNIEIECRGDVYTLGHNGAIRNNQYVDVATIHYSKELGITKLTSHIGEAVGSSKTIWSLDTLQYHKVSMILNSPNHWDTKTGNKHTFFILDKATNPESPRGVFNEFLKPSLLTHKRVFEVLGNRIQVTEDKERQLSGVGVSSTLRAEVICRVTGKFARLLRVKF
jgi:hypothetical protein